MNTWRTPGAAQSEAVSGQPFGWGGRKVFAPASLAAERSPVARGPGKNRGGNGIRISYRFLEKGQIAIHDDRWFVKPWGVNGGGEPGMRSRKILARTDGTTIQLPSKCDDIEVFPGDLLHFDTWGGGGWGDPLERAATLVGYDVKRGLVTIEGAKRYGVVCSSAGEVDIAATEKPRAEIRHFRGPLPIFNTGGEIEELRKRVRQRRVSSLQSHLAAAAQA